MTRREHWARLEQEREDALRRKERDEWYGNLLGAAIVGAGFAIMGGLILAMHNLPT